MLVFFFVATIFSVCIKMFVLFFTLVLSKLLKIIKEATSTVNIVMSILGLDHLGAGWTDIQTLLLELSHNSLGYAPRLKAQFCISLLWQVHSFSLQAANVPSTESITAPPQTHVSGSFTLNALPAARVFFKGKVNSQWHLKITTYSPDCWNRRKILYGKIECTFLFYTTFK